MLIHAWFSVSNFTRHFYQNELTLWHQLPLMYRAEQSLSIISDWFPWFDARFVLPLVVHCLYPRLQSAALHRGEGLQTLLIYSPSWSRCLDFYTCAKQHERILEISEFCLWLLPSSCRGMYWYQLPVRLGDINSIFHFITSYSRAKARASQCQTTKLWTSEGSLQCKVCRVWEWPNGWTWMQY